MAHLSRHNQLLLLIPFKQIMELAQGLSSAGVLHGCSYTTASWFLSTNTSKSRGVPISLKISWRHASAFEMVLTHSPSSTSSEASNTVTVPMCGPRGKWRSEFHRSILALEAPACPLISIRLHSWRRWMDHLTGTIDALWHGFSHQKGWGHLGMISKPH